MGGRSFWRVLALVLWGITLPFSALVWQPSEAHEDVPWRRAVPLLGIAVIIAGIAVVAYMVVLACT
jgi:hypothetical protein